MELKRESGRQGNRGRMKYREARMGNGGEIGRWDHLQGTGLLKETLGSGKETGRTKCGYTGL
jgi:hypothetical protein